MNIPDLFSQLDLSLNELPVQVVSTRHSFWLLASLVTLVLGLVIWRAARWYCSRLPYRISQGLYRLRRNLEAGRNLVAVADELQLLLKKLLAEYYSQQELIAQTAAELEVSLSAHQARALPVVAIIKALEQARFSGGQLDKEWLSVTLKESEICVKNLLNAS